MASKRKTCKNGGNKWNCNCTLASNPTNKTVIAVRSGNNPDVVLLDYNYSYSPTTSKYLYQFLGFKKDIINKKIQNNSIRIMDLNYNATDTSTTYEYKTAMHNLFIKFINTEHSTA